MRETKITPAEGARRVCNIPVKDLYLGFKVKSLVTGRLGIVGDYKDVWYDGHYIDVVWENGRLSSHVYSDYDLVEEFLEEEVV